MQTLDVSQALAMIELARGGAIFIPVLLGVLCGLRRGEICALRWRNIDLDSGRLSVVASMEEVRGAQLGDQQRWQGNGAPLAVLWAAIADNKPNGSCGLVSG